MLQASLVKHDFVSMQVSLGWSSVNDDDVGYLGQLYKNGEGLCLDEVEVTMAKKVSVPFILFLLDQFQHEVGLGLEHLGIHLELLLATVQQGLVCKLGTFEVLVNGHMGSANLV